MQRLPIVLVVFVVALTTTSAGVFDRKPKPTNPSERVGQLLAALKMDPDAGKRADAANELRGYDAGTYPEVVPALIEALQKDASTSVRREAAQSLGRIKPATMDAHQALEQARESDASTLVRVQARMALVGYRVAESKPATPPTTANDGPMIKMPSLPTFSREKTQPVQVLPPPSKLLTPVSRPLPKPEGDSKPMPPPPASTKPAERKPEPILAEPRPISPSFSSARPITPAVEDRTPERPVEHRPILAAPK